jgi:predicted DNA-binding transcriptional regulator AlpA
MPRSKSPEVVIRRLRAADPLPVPVLEVKDDRLRVVRLEEAADRLGVGVDTLRNWWADPGREGIPANLPKPRRVGPNRVGVLSSDLDECLRTLPFAGMSA